VDADFEQHYQAAERAYGLGEYAEAHAIASTLWGQLESASNDQDPTLVSGWRAVVSLLLGHIQLHGLQHPEQAAVAYRRVLEGDVDATIAALAEQGLERCRSEQIASEADMTPATNGAIPDLLKDPFLSTDPDQARPAPAGVFTAMPWLSSDKEARAMPTPDPNPTPVRSPEPTVSPEANPLAEVQKQEPEPTAEEPPLDAVEPATQEPAATKLLENSWLRVQLQRDIKSPTDSVEPMPMGLINRIKGIFDRSAGR